MKIQFLVLCLTGYVTSRPVHIKCDLTVVAGKANEGKNIITMSGMTTVMGIPMLSDDMSISTEKTTVTPGETIDITVENLGSGFLHADYGAIGAGADGSGAQVDCGTSPNTMRTFTGTAGDLVLPWEAPQASGLVTFVGATASGYTGTFKRNVNVTVMVSGDAATPSPASPTASPVPSDFDNVTEAPTAGSPTVDSGACATQTNLLISFSLLMVLSFL